MQGRLSAAPAVKCYEFALAGGEYDQCTARTSNAAPTNLNDDQTNLNLQSELERMKIRKLIESDYDMVAELWKELDEIHVQARPDYFVHRDKDEIYPKDAFFQNLADPDVLQLGVFENEKIVGFVRATLWEESGMVRDVKTVCLDNIYVLPSHRRRGVAKKLFAEVELWAKEQGAIRLDLHTWDFNKDAIALYQAMGMSPQRYVFEKKL